MPDEEWKDPIDITTEQWAAILKNEDIITEKDLRLLNAAYNCGSYEFSSPQLAQLLGVKNQGVINLQVWRMAERIVKKLDVKNPPKYHHSERYGPGINWFNVPFWAEERKTKIYWILRPELREALRQMDEEEARSLEIAIPEEIQFDGHEALYEGIKKQIYVNSYERNRGARDLCVKYYGAKCIICQFDFEEMYGEAGRNIIHVHHLKPLSEIGKEYKVDPIKDLRPVCPNCHVIIHSKNPLYSVDEVKSMIMSAGAK